MVFSSILFLFRFLPAFLLLYYAAPKKRKNVVLFFASLLFYAWGEPAYILLMLFSTFSDYIHGLLIEKRKQEGRTGPARALLLSSLTINLGLLCFFKYLAILPLPIGISFYTFQTMSYSIDVYRGKTKAQRDLLAFATYVAMFPQLIAGPIVRYETVERELTDRAVTQEDLRCGVRRFVLGLAKKVLLANQIGLVWEEIRALPVESLPVAAAWTGVLAYAFQIYFDFSGYSDMAIGLGRMMGFSFPENFRYPYLAASITDFWRRWHISLSSWFREYVYIPLGGNRKGLPRQLVHILAVWALTGIWHGASWNFLLWGLWFAFFLILEKLFLLKLLQKLPRAAGWGYAMLVVLLGWAIFAIPDRAVLTAYLGAMFGMGSRQTVSAGLLYLLQNKRGLFLVLCIAATPLPARLGRRLLYLRKREGEKVSTGEPAETIFLAAAFLLSVAFLVDASYNPFLYFRF